MTIPCRLLHIPLILSRAFRTPPCQKPYKNSSTQRPQNFLYQAFVSIPLLFILAVRHMIYRSQSHVGRLPAVFH